MKKILDLITEEMEQAFADAGYEKELARVTLSNRPDLCEYHQQSAFALCDVGAFSGDLVQLSLFHLPRIL